MYPGTLARVHHQVCCKFWTCVFNSRSLRTTLSAACHPLRLQLLGPPARRRFHGSVCPVPSSSPHGPRLRILQDTIYSGICFPLSSSHSAARPLWFGGFVLAIFAFLRYTSLVIVSLHRAAFLFIACGILVVELFLEAMVGDWIFFFFASVSTDSGSPPGFCPRSWHCPWRSCSIPWSSIWFFHFPRHSGPSTLPIFPFLPDLKIFPRGRWSKDEDKLKCEGEVEVQALAQAEAPFPAKAEAKAKCYKDLIPKRLRIRSRRQKQNNRQQETGNEKKRKQEIKEKKRKSKQRSPLLLRRLGGAKTSVTTGADNSQVKTLCWQ